MLPTTTAPRSPQRPRSDCVIYDRLLKQQKLSYAKLTGLEDSGVLDETGAKKACTTVTKTEGDIYQRRKKVAKYTRAIRSKRKLANQIKGDWFRMPIKGQKGMANLTGVLCYRNSMLQVLLHLPKFVNWVMDYHRPENCVSDDQEKCLSCCLRMLTQNFWRGARGSAELSKVLLRMDKLFDHLGWEADTRSGQADPDEQAAWMLEIMRKELPTSIFAYLEAFFQLVTTSSVRCNKCGHESKTDAHDDRSLSIPIEPRIPNGNLAMYLQKFMDEVVEDYRCEGCQHKGAKRRVQQIDHGPDILVVQLKRFRWNGTKNSAGVGINISLDLGEYRDANNKDRLQYELTAVIKHTGSSGLGHYVCNAKGPDGNWYGFDDLRVSTSSVTDATNVKCRFTPYMLFFQRKEE